MILRHLEPPATANDFCHMSRDIVWLGRARTLAHTAAKLELRRAQNRSAMRLTLINQTGSTILYHPIPTTIDTTWQLQIALLPSSSITTDLPKRCSKLTLIPREQVKHDLSSELGETRLKEMTLKTGFDVCIKSFVKSRTLEMVDGTEECPCPWRIYRMKVCFRRLIDIFLMLFCGRYQGHTIT